MHKISEILRQRYELNLSYRDIAKSLNISIGSITEYIRRAKAAGLSWPLGELSEEDLYNKLFLPANKTNNKQKNYPNWDLVYKEHRKKGVTLLLLWREYREINNNGIGYTMFCKRYHEYVKTLKPTMRQLHKAGEKTFVDYAGMTMPWIEPKTGDIHDAQIFVGSLGASQYCFVEATRSQQLSDWINSHIRMFEYFGGVSEILVPDNLKSGVTKAHRYDPDINLNYQHFSVHYGVAIVPARSAAPKDKAKVENAVGCIERQILAPLRHHTFTSIGEINEAIRNRLNNFNAQPFQKLDGSRLDMFNKIDKLALKPLPKERYQYAIWKKLKVNIDYHISFDKHYYSVPYKYISEYIDIRATGSTIECFYKSKRIAIHERNYIKHKFTTITEHMPTSHQNQAKWTPERIARWAKKIGEQTNKFIKNMIDSKPFPQQAFRSCLGLLRLGKRYGEKRLEMACERALEGGATRYQHVESILKNNMDSIATQKFSTPTLSEHENIRGSHYYN